MKKIELLFYLISIAGMLDSDSVIAALEQLDELLDEPKEE